MKRKSVIITLLALLGLLLIIPVLAQAAPVGKFTNIEGNVDVTPPGKEAVKANLGGELNAGDIIRTKSKAKCEVTFLDGSVLRLAENTRLRVSEFAQEKEKRTATLDLFRGKIQNIVKAAGGTSQSKYEVHTPTAVCGVRGTQFFTYYQAGVSGAVVTEGTVYAYSANKPGDVRTVGTGQAMVVTNPNVPPAVRQATATEMQQHQKDTAPADKPKSEGKTDEEKSETATAKAEGGKQEEGKKEEQKKGEDKPAETKTAEKTEESQKTVIASANADAKESSGAVDIVPKDSTSGTTGTTGTSGTNGTSGTSGTTTTTQLLVDTTQISETFSTLATGTGTGGSTGTGSGSGNTITGNNQGTDNPAANVINTINQVVQTDTTPPKLTALSFPGQLTSNSTATFKFTTDEPASLSYRLDGGDWVRDTQKVTEFDRQLNNLAEKAHTLEVEVVDTANLVSSWSYSWTTDYTPPVITLTAKPATVISASSAHIGVTASEPVNYTYSLNGATVTSTDLINLPEGDNTFTVTATDPAGLSSTQTYSWRTDYTNPVFTLSSLPSSGTSADSAHIGVTASEPVTYTYTLNGAAVTSTDLTNLPEGNNTFTVTATDLAGHTSTQTYTWQTEYPTPVSGSVAVGGVISSGSLAAQIDDSSNEGALTFSGTAPTGLPAGAWGGAMDGALGDGKYAGFLTGVSGSWEGLMSSLYVTGTGEAGYLTGDLAGTFDEASKTLSGAGTIKRSDILGRTELTPDTLATSMEILGMVGDTGETGFPLPLPGSIVVGGAISPAVTSEGQLLGITAAHPVTGRERILSVWGTTTTGGLYTNITGATGWEGAYGRSGNFNNDPANPYFMLGNISGTDDGAGHVSISGDLDYLERGYLGSIGLAYRGKYEAAAGTGQGPDNSPYSSAGAGTFTLAPLAFGGSITGGSFHFPAGSGLLSTGSLSGLWGGTDTPGSGAAAVLAMGEYSGRPAGSSLFTADMDGYNAPLGEMSSSGFVGGRAVGNGLDTAFAGFYARALADKTEVGFLVSAGSGNSLLSGTDSGLWKVAGDISAFKLEDLPAGMPFSLMPPTDISQTFATPLMNEYAGGPAINVTTELLRTSSLFGHDWGIWQTVTGGTYDSATWTAGAVSTAWTIDHNSLNFSDTVFQVADTTWNGTSQTLSGQTALAIASWEEAKTYVGGGNIKGTFDPATWGAVATGGWLETGKFLQMAGDATTEATASAVLRALNIPSILVGRATLTQTPETAVNSLTNLSLHNVGFFATSTGAAPRIWATDDITGNYSLTTPPSATGPVVSLSSGPGGLTAYFGIRNWDEGSGTWGANIIGGGALSGGSYNGALTLTGGATGLFGSGSLTTGTAAGTALGFAPSTDLTPPALSFSQQPAANSNSPSTTFAFSPETGATYRYSLDGSTYAPLTGGILSRSDLTEGQHTLTLSGTDQAGNLSLTSYTWTTDYTAPVIALSETPEALTNANSANIGVTAADANPTTTTYTLDGAAVTSPNLTGLSEGAHTLIVKVTDAAGNISTKDFSWTTDYTAPGITLAGTPATLTNVNSANIGITATDAHPAATTYTLDGAAVASPNLTDLGEGSHTLIVTATDAAGNSTTKDYTWTTDYTAPVITLAGTPAPLTNVNSANIGVTATDAHPAATTYTLDGVAVASPNLTGLSEGSHTLAVTATDAAGNSTSKDYSWTTDYTPPVVSLLPTPLPRRVTGSDTAEFAPSAVDAHPGKSYYRIDEGAWQLFEGSPLTGLSEGKRKIEFKADDLAGNESLPDAGSSYEWFIGKRQYTLQGTVTGDLSGNVLTSSEGIRAISNGNQGAWLLDLGGSYETPPTSLNLTAGGTGYEPNNPGLTDGYWISHLNAAAADGAINGASTLTYLSTTTLGQGAGAVTGSLSNGAWQIQDLGFGTYTETPLVLSGPLADLDEAFMFTAADGTTAWGGSLSGRMGGTVLPWNTAIPLQERSILAMGTYANPNNGQAWWLWNPTAAGATATTDGGALLGDIVGVNYQDGRSEGVYGALFVRPAGQDTEGNPLYRGGYIGYNLSGSFYPGLGTDTAPGTGMWELSGNPYAFYEQAVTGITPGLLNWDNISYREANGLAGGDISISDVWASFYSLPGQHWGAWSNELGGTLSSLPAGQWDAKAGGRIEKWTGDTSTAEGYWLADLSGGAWTEGKVDGNIAYRYLTREAMGTFSNRLFGAYQSTEGGYNWQALSGGVYTETPLTFSGTADGGLLYSNDGGYLYEGGHANGLLGGTALTPPWSGAPASVSLMGSYTDSFANAKPYLMYGSGWYFDGGTLSGTATDEGAFSGYMVGLWKNGNIRAKALSLYITPERKAGYLEGDITGNYYPALGMWEASGALVADPGREKATAVNPADLTSSLATNFFDGYQGRGAFAAEDGGTIGVQYAAGDPIRISDQNWGIWNAGFSGAYAGAVADSWGLVTGGSLRSGQWDSTEDGHWLGHIAGATWANAEIGGAFTATGLTNEARYDFYNGTIAGMYDDVTGVWQAAGIGLYNRTPTDFGGDWYNSTLYNNNGTMSWNSEGSDHGSFGFTKRLDGNYDFLAIGDFVDYGIYDASENLAFGGPYLWSGSLWYAGNTGSNLEGFTTGIKEKQNPGVTGGAMTGYTAALYYTADGKVGLIEGGLTGSSYEMDESGSVVQGMWKVESGTNGLTATDKTGLLPADFAPANAYIDLGSLRANAGGSFGSAGAEVGAFRGESNNGAIKFIAYDLYDEALVQTGSKSLPFGIYNLKLGAGAEANFYSGKPAEASVSWNGKIGGEIGSEFFPGFWLADLTGAWDSTAAGQGTINGLLAGKYLTLTHVGTTGGPLYGLYNAGGLDEFGKEYGTWSGASAGTWSGEPLTFGGLVLGESLAGLMGGTTSLWTATEENPAPVTMMGQYNPSGSASHLWQAEVLAGQNMPWYYSSAVSDGGAYAGFLGYAESGGSMDGGLLALYIAPDGQAGYLRGSLAGTAYPEIGMFATEGGLYPTPVVSGIGIAPENLYDSIWQTNSFLSNDETLAGTFAGGGKINAGGFSGEEYYGLGNMYTMSIVDYEQNKAEPWGIYAQSLAGTYADPGATWTAKAGGASPFGAYNIVVNSYNGYYDYADGGYYEYTYYSDNRSGQVYYRRADAALTSYDISYGADGSYTKTTYSYDAASGSYSVAGTETGTWETATPLASLVETPPDSNTTYFSKYLDSAGEDDQGYWLADISDGTWSGNKLTGKLNGKFLTRTKLGTLTGNLLGLYNSTDNTWQAGGLGTWSGTDLKFVNQASAGMTSVTRYYTGNYSYPDGGSYSFNYYADNQSGTFSYYRPAGATEEYNITVIYHADGKVSGYDYVRNTPISSDSWDVQSLSELAIPRVDADLATLVSKTDNAHIFADGSISDALLGGTASLWGATSLNPAAATMIGQYVPGASGANLWNTMVESYNYKDGTSTTYDGGAYKGYLAGTNVGGAMEGRFLALYLDPSGNAGYLKGSLTGSAYPEIKMFEMNGSIRPDQVVANIGILPGDLVNSIAETGSWGNTAFLATLGEGGKVWTDSQSLYTMSLIKDNAAQNWGIYRQELAGRFTADTAGGTTWSGMTGGDGYIGAYHDNYSSTVHDYGYWLADIAGTLASDKLSGDLTSGRFITGTRLGTLQGDLFGVYSTSDNTWQAASLGTWNGADLKFVSDASGSLTSVTNHRTGIYTYDADSGTYSYNYYTDNSGGSVSYWRPGAEGVSPENYTITYNADGTYTKTAYDQTGNPTTTTGTWSTSLASLETLPDSSAGSWTSTGSSVVSLSDGSISAALLGGVDSLWNASAGTPAALTMIGQYEPGVKSSHLWSTDISSRNYKDGSATTYEGGAYQVYLAATDVGGSLEGRMIGLYIDPEGNAGYLKGSLAGSMHPEIKMFSMTGSISPGSPVASGMEVPTEYFPYAEIMYGSDKGFSATLGAGGTILAEGFAFTTMAIWPQPWGIYRQELEGKFTNPDGATTWAGKTGGRLGLGDSDGYWLADVSGTFATGRITGEIANGRFLTDTRLGAPGSLPGELIGVYNTLDNTWQGVALGTWQATDLKFMNNVPSATPLTTATRYYTGSYNYPDGGSYTFNYYADNRSGYVSYFRPYTMESYDITYNADGTYTGYDTINEINLSGRWDTDPTSLAFLGTPPDASNAILTSSDDSVHTLSDGAIGAAIMGGTASLWTATQAAPADVTMLGRYEPGQASSHIWSTAIHSSNYKDYSDTTYDGGAYQGYLSGTNVSGSLAARLIALYIDKPDVDGISRVGYLKGSLTGSMYPEINMFEMTGGIYANSTNFIVADIGIAPHDLVNSVLETGDWGNKAFSATLGTNGQVETDSLSLNTLSLYNASGTQPWGIYRQELVGQFTNPDGATSWAGKIGGSGYLGYFTDSSSLNQPDDGYWLADVSGTWGNGKFSGDLNPATSLFITGTRLGIGTIDGSDGLSGELFGVYNTLDNTWQGVGLGTWQGTDLQFVSDLQATDTSGQGNLNALLGGSTSLWTGTDPIPVTMMGLWDGGNGLWPSPLYSTNFKDNSYTTYDATPGAYRGFSSIVMDSGQGVDAGMIALYVDPTGQAGYLKGTLSGTAYPALNLFAAAGSLKREEMGTAPAGVTTANFYDNDIITETLPLYLFATDLSASLDSLTESKSEAWITADPSWGIWQSVLEGSGLLPETGNWTAIQGIDATYWTNVSEVTSSTATAKFAGNVAGAKADWVSATTSVFGGEIKGLFDPTAATWKSIAQGASMETDKFLAMTTSNPAALQAMNIPAIQVGSATLSQGADTVNNLSNVTMANVGFFATSTGSVPKIWATNAVSGNFSATPVVGGAAVPLAGGGLNANFAIGNWNTAAGTWGANVTGGTGTLSGGSYNGPVNFQGGAAGQIGAGSFTGTGAGTVTP